jgi:hypothetical protein
MDLNDTLGQFDAVEANLHRLEKVWEEMVSLIPDGLVFIGGSPEGIRYETLRRAFADLVKGLPPINGRSIESFPFEIDEIAQTRLDLLDLGPEGSTLAFERQVTMPGEAIADYRFQMSRQRAVLVRNRTRELVGDIDLMLPDLAKRTERNGDRVVDPAWDQFRQSFDEIVRLIGASIVKKAEWYDLSRHIHFGQGGDLHDIAETDWPSVREDIEAAMYDELEPLPVQLADLADLASAKPAGSVQTKLSWQTLAADEFERLIFNIFRETSGYENPRWLMHTNAPDRGRDLSVDRIITDPLSGTTRQRVIVQCKHWLSKSLKPTDISDAIVPMEFWDSPPVDALIIATSGRFTADAVEWAEKHNANGRRPTVDLWAESHLESLLAERSHLVAEFRLRET